MANRMACDHSDVVASVASFAGGSWLDPANCPAAEPVSGLLVHGTEDAVIQYNGGTLPLIPGVGPYPSHEQSVEHWGSLHSCEDESVFQTPSICTKVSLARNSGCGNTVIAGPESPLKAGVFKAWDTCRSGAISLGLGR